MSDTPEISIIIVTHNSLPALSACLEAVRVSSVFTRCEVIGVDNASTDESTRAMRRVIPDAKVVGLSRNLGFAGACNRGAAEAAGEFLVFLNPDTEVDVDAVENLIAVCRQRDCSGLASGRMRFRDGSFQATCREFPTVGNLWHSRGSVLGRVCGRRGTYTLPDYDETTEVPAVAATFVTVRRSVFEAAGGFDSRFFMYMEDTDLSLRLHQAGRVNLFVPSAGAVHQWGGGSTASRTRRLWYQHRSVWKYFAKHHPGVRTFLLLPLMLCANFVVKSLMLADGGR